MAGEQEIKVLLHNRKCVLKMIEEHEAEERAAAYREKNKEPDAPIMTIHGGV